MKKFIRVRLHAIPGNISDFFRGKINSFTFATLNTDFISEILPLDEEDNSMTVIVMSNGDIYVSIDTFKEINDALSHANSGVD